MENPIDVKAAYQVLEQYSISSEVDPKDIEKQVIEVSVERKGLKDKFDSIVKDFTQYERLEKNAQARRSTQTLEQTQKNEIEK